MPLSNNARPQYFRILLSYPRLYSTFYPFTDHDTPDSFLFIPYQSHMTM